MKDAVRFYMVPDMGHCPGTAGPSAYSVDTFHIIQDWKEKGQAPDQLVMTHHVNGKRTVRCWSASIRKSPRTRAAATSTIRRTTKAR